MTINSQIKNANRAIKDAKKAHKMAFNILNQKKPASNNTEHSLLELNKIMKKISINSEKAMKGAKFAESRARTRLAAVKKASSKTIKHTANAKRTAIISKNSAYSAIETSRKMSKNPRNLKRLEKTYKKQIRRAFQAAKESEKNAMLALKSSKTARAAARISLEPKKL